MIKDRKISFTPHIPRIVTKICIKILDRYNHVLKFIESKIIVKKFFLKIPKNF